MFDFLKENDFSPFPAWQVQSFARQILVAVEFLHGIGLVHTDLKPGEFLCFLLFWGGGGRILGVG